MLAYIGDSNNYLTTYLTAQQRQNTQPINRQWNYQKRFRRLQHFAVKRRRKMSKTAFFAAKSESFKIPEKTGCQPKK